MDDAMMQAQLVRLVLFGQEIGAFTCFLEGLAACAAWFHALHPEVSSQVRQLAIIADLACEC
jgi:hypothetical protein